MIRHFEENDLARIGQLQPDGWQDIATYFRFYLDSPFCHPLKIEDGGRIVALGCVILHEATAWLSHIIVAEDARRRGLGLAMTEELIAQAERDGRHTQLLIATDMGRPLYERLGFRFSCEYRDYGLHDPDVVAPLPLARPVEPADLKTILELDRKASGEGRSTLLKGHIDGGIVIDDGDLRGFYLPAMDEGLVVAGDAEAGLALMQLRMATSDKSVVLPAGNEMANAYLLDQGLVVRRRLARMVRNGADPLNQQMLFNRIGGHVG
jgi:GNAT superfamily N-acetyltransferase